VAVVGADVGDAELDRLAAGGVCGLRVNFVAPQSWGTTTPGMLEQLAHKAARLGWHIQLLALPAQIVAMQALLARLPVPLAIDHLGRIDADQGQASPAFSVLRRLLDAGNTWLKLSGVYMASRTGAPDYGDTLTLGQAFVRAAPERMLWGSDWPHTTEPSGSVNDADLLDVLRAWCGSDAALDGILVANPARLYGFPGDS
jgi:predicted TIM-barrel fold metal-dependent hydrolase